MEVIEAFIKGKKNDDNLCEDSFLITDDFIVVADGVTTKSDRLFYGVTGGKAAAVKLCETVKNFEADITVKQAVAMITQSMTELYDENEPTGNAAAGAIIFSKEKCEIWSVGDCQCIINGEFFSHEKELDRINSDMRALVLAIEKKQGKTQEALLCDDAGRDFILPILKKQCIFANSTGRFSYGVFNGKPVPDEHIVVHKVKKGDEIVLASDGYPSLKGTLEESEKLLEEELKNNPLCDGKYRSTKGMAKDALSFDDRTYIRFKV